MILFVLYSGRKIRTLNCPFSLGITVPLFSELVSLFSRNMQLSHPMEAVLGIFQRYLSKFRITTNGDQCISCGNCSTYCEMGIDVRAYAQRGENIVRASCVGCGVCSAVCPKGVLKLENGGTFKDRFFGSDRPLGELIDSLKHV